MTLEQTAIAIATGSCTLVASCEWRNALPTSPGPTMISSAPATSPMPMPAMPATATGRRTRSATVFLGANAAAMNAIATTTSMNS